MIDKQLNYGRLHIKNFTANIPDNAIVLDIGAGHGDDLLLVKCNNESVQLNGIECYKPHQTFLETKDIRVHDINVENQELPFADESVDLVISNQIFEHCKEIWWMMHEITRVLRVGGQLIIGVPNLASLHNRLLLCMGKQPSCIRNDSAHVRGFTKTDLQKFIEDGSGNVYKLEKFKGSNFYPFPAFLAKPLANLFPSLAASIFLKFEKIAKSNKNFLSFPKNELPETNFFLGKSKFVFSVPKIQPLGIWAHKKRPVPFVDN